MSPGRDPGGGARSPEPPERRDRGTTRFRKQRQLRPAPCSGDPGRRSVPRARARAPPGHARPLTLHACAAQCVAPGSPPASGPLPAPPAGRPWPASCRSGGRGQPPTPVIASPPGAAVMNEPRTRVLSGIDAVISSYWRRDAGRNREHASGPPLAVHGGQKVWGGEREGRVSGPRARPGPRQRPEPSAPGVLLRVHGPWFSYRRTRRAS